MARSHKVTMESWWCIQGQHCTWNACGWDDLAIQNGRLITRSEYILMDGSQTRVVTIHWNIAWAFSMRSKMIPVYSPAILQLDMITVSMFWCEPFIVQTFQINVAWNWVQMTQKWEPKFNCLASMEIRWSVHPNWRACRAAIGAVRFQCARVSEIWAQKCWIYSFRKYSENCLWIEWMDFDWIKKYFKNHLQVLNVVTFQY